MAIVDMPALVEAVRQRPDGSPLERIEAALAVSGELVSGADELVGYFVAEARQSGCSWTEIGEQIGVSKQAARQRFTRQLAGDARDLVEQPRLLACREAARREARADGASEVGTHHQLIGLFEDGAAAAIMERLGIRVEMVRQAARDLFPGGGQRGAFQPPESADAREALAGAASLARRAGLGHVGTEHLLGALALDPGSRARRVLIRLDASIPAIKKELECYISPRRQRRRRGKTADQRCSFCGKPRSSGVDLVSGPGVWICAPCIDLAGEIVAERAGGPARSCDSPL
jgi:ATP-dependent Clp protease ATP-binding subunit ClpA